MPPRESAVFEVVRYRAGDYFRVYWTDLVGNGFEEGVHLLVETWCVGVAEVAFYCLQVSWKWWAALEGSSDADEAEESSHSCGSLSSGLVVVL